MKHFYLRMSVASLLTSIITVSMYAQDTMVTQDGDVKTVYVVDIGNTAVFYKEENTDAASIQRINKSQIFVLKHADGTKYDLGDTPAVAVTTTTTESTPQLNDEVSEEAKQRNRELIESINGLNPICTGGKSGDANKVFCTLGVTENSVLSNDELEISITIGQFVYEGKSKVSFCIPYWSYDTRNHAMEISLKNKTTKTIYIDLGNTFFIRGENAQSYYVPSASSTSNTSNSGVGVNAGAVASAMGIGGSIGKLAGGVTVGGGSSSTTVDITYSQRVIAIPPKSSKVLDAQLMFGNDYKPQGIYVYKLDNYSRFFLKFYIIDKNKPVGKKKELFSKYKIQIGETFSYDYEHAPIKFAFMTTYSLTEDCTQTKSMSFELYSKNIMGFKYGHLDLNESFGFAGDLPNGKWYSSMEGSFPLE